MNVIESSGLPFPDTDRFDLVEFEATCVPEYWESLDSATSEPLIPEPKRELTWKMVEALERAGMEEDLRSWEQIEKDWANETPDALADKMAEAREASGDLAERHESVDAPDIDPR